VGGRFKNVTFVTFSAVPAEPSFKRERERKKEKVYWTTE